MFNEYFDLDFYQQLLVCMEEEEEPWEEWEEYVEVFLETAPLIRDKYKVEFVKTIHRISGIANKSLLFKIFDLVEPIISEIDEKIGNKMIYGIANNKFKEPNDVIRLSQFMRMISFDLSADQELAERLDEFIAHELEKDNVKIVEEIELLVEHIGSLQEDNFEKLSETSNLLINHVAKSSLYDRILAVVNKYFNSTQRETLFSNLLHPINNSGASVNQFDRINAAYAVLGGEEKNHTYIKRNVEQGIDYLTNHAWYQYNGWANGFLKLLKETHHLLMKHIWSVLLMYFLIIYLIIQMWH